MNQEQQKEHKKKLRALTLEKLKAISDEQREQDEHKLFDQFKQFIAKNNYQKIGIYYGVKPELNTRQLFDELTHTSFYLPRIEPERKLQFYQFTSDADLESAWKNIKQPKDTAQAINSKDLDLIVVPGLAFMGNGYRIGFGGGYYDRHLSQLEEVPTVSLIFDEQLYPSGEWEADWFDIPIQTLITANKGVLNGNLL